jgi:hypothetical protein
VLGQEELDVMNGPGEDAGVDSEELGEEGAGAESAQVEHGGQGSVGGGRLVRFSTSYRWRRTNGAAGTPS